MSLIQVLDALNLTYKIRDTDLGILIFWDSNLLFVGSEGEVWRWLVDELLKGYQVSTVEHWQPTENAIARQEL